MRFSSRLKQLLNHMGLYTPTPATVSRLEQQIEYLQKQEARRQHLQAVFAALTEAVTPAEVAEVIVGLGLSTIGGTVGSVCLITEDGTRLEICNRRGISEETYQKHRYTPLAAHAPLTDAIRQEAPLWINDRTTYLRLYPHFESIVMTNGTHGIASLPLTIKGRIIGGFTVSFAEPNALTEEVRDSLTILAQHCSQAMERARLYDLERRARRKADASNIRLEFLSEASSRLASSLDYEETLQNVADLAVRSIADWCGVYILKNNQISSLVIAHKNPTQVALAEEYHRRYPSDIDAPSGLGHVIRTGKSELTPHIPDEMLEIIPDLEQRAMIRQLGLKSLMVVPLKIYDHVIGAMTLALSTAQRQFEMADLTLAEELARRAATALENARLYREIQEERERFRVTLASIGDAVIATDLEGRITFMNPVAQTLIQAPESLGKPLPDVFTIIDEASRTPLENPVERVIQSGAIVSLANHTLLVRPDGSEIPIDNSGAPICDHEQRMIGVIMVFRDVTTRQQAENELRQRTDELTSANADLQKFTYIASHDLQEPLRKIQALSTRFQSRYAGVLDEEGQDYLRRMQSAASRAQAFIQDVLLYSKITRHSEQFMMVDLNEVMQSVLETLDEQLESTGGQVEISPLPMLYGDPFQMEHLFQNLLLNALKYRRPEVIPVIRITATVTEDECKILVADNGIGFEDKYREKIFDIFERLDKRQTGSGVGLAICRKIVERHGGTITATGVPNVGATFEITLPLHKDV